MRWIRLECDEVNICLRRERNRIRFSICEYGAVKPVSGFTVSPVDIDRLIEQLRNVRDSVPEEKA